MCDNRIDYRPNNFSGVNCGFATTNGASPHGNSLGWRGDQASDWMWRQAMTRMPYPKTLMQKWRWLTVMRKTWTLILPVVLTGRKCEWWPFFSIVGIKTVTTNTQSNQTVRKICHLTGRYIIKVVSFSFVFFEKTGDNRPPQKNLKFLMI